MKKKRIVACLLTALTVLTVSSSLGGCYHIAFHEEYQQYDKVAYLEGESEKISFRGQTYREVDLDESYSKGFKGNYYDFYDYNREMIGIDKEIGWLYKGCSPLWGTHEGDEEAIWLARDANLSGPWVYLREDIELPTLENCVLDKAAVGHSIEGKPYVQLPENTYLWDIIDKDFAVDRFEMESQVGAMYFKVRDFEYLWTSFAVYERRGELYFLENQRYYYEGLWGAYRVKDEYQYAFKSLLQQALKQDTQGGVQ